MQMYGKLFASLYQGTIRGKPHEILVFTNLLAHMDKDYNVDKHPRAIADEVGLTVEEVRAALKYLESPDPESRSPEHEGRRILRIDEHRDWGWHMVNGKKYNGYRSEEDRKEQNRLAQQRWRARQGSNADVSNSKQSVSTNKQDKPTKDLILKTEDGKSKTEEERQKKEKSASPITFPACLDNVDFRAIWTEWEAHRREKGKKLTPASIRQQLTVLEAAGCADAIETVRYSIRQGYTGLDPEWWRKNKPKSTAPITAITADMPFWEPNPPQP